MKKFRFTLQTPLNVKLTIEKQLMGELSVCNGRLREFLSKQEENYARMARHSETYTQMLSEGLQAGDLPIWHRSFLADRERIEHQQKVIEQAEGEVRRLQNKLTEAMKERKTLESLKEKQYEEYKAAIRAEDAALMDDFMSSQNRTVTRYE